MNHHTRTSLAQLFSRLGLYLALCLLPCLTGCVLVAAGAVGVGAVVYSHGELESLRDESYPKMVEATRAALKELEFVKISEKKDALEAEFIYRTALDKKVTIKLNKVAAQETRVRIRIDLIGDESLSKAIFDKIKANL